ncbi:MAG: C25 family cysteine peptidase, partial [Candidatus Cloacimonadaceae bacterium]|nr:C25 family cysteine peptidase [Candidatus Cloacimonadaceae bacterium]
MRKTVLIVLMMVLFGALTALNLSISIDPQAWDMNTRGQNQPLIMEAGNPMLPFYPVQVLVPFGHEVESVSVELEGLRSIRNDVSLDYVRQQQPTSMPGPDLTIRNAAVWNTDALYPSNAYDYYGTQFFRGFQIAVINIYPWRYNPVTRQIFAATSVNISIQSSFEPDTASRQAAFVTHNEATYAELGRHIKNTDIIATYSQSAIYRNVNPRSRLIDLSNPKRMIIITDAIRAPWFSDYVTWRTAMGVSTPVFLTNDIYQEYDGVDNAEKVRNFIIDAYTSWAGSSTPLEYVILGGDDEIVPERGARGVVGQTVDNRMPTDIYFSNLDGTWNANGNNIWGEVSDAVDMIPEVHIGRFPAESLTEFNNIFRKTRHYVENTSFANNVSLMIGENLNWNPVTWGGDYKDDVAQHIPNDYHIQTLYQRDGNYSGPLIWNAINDGANVMNHMGHANEASLMGQAINTVNSLTNTNYGFLYTQGCYPAAFDQRTSGDGESIGEHFVMASGALFAFIGNTRYGWYMPGSINGASQYYDRSYFIGMFQQNLSQLGNALTYSRLDNLNAALASDVMRWCYYEVVLFGDPSIEVKEADPAMPYLTLHSYTIDDSEGDNDGTINPGEIIRIYPRIRNHPDWHTAYNVSLSLEGLPAGSILLSDEVVISQLNPGAISSENIFFRVQLGDALSFGNYSVRLVADALHPQTNESVGERLFTLDFSITLLDNRFPWESDFATKSSPVVYDFNGDGELDILYLDVFGGGHFVGNDGDEYGNFGTNASLNINRSFAMADLDGDGVMDLAISSRSGEVVAIKTDGTQLFSYQTDTQLLNTPMIGDVDGDGNPDIVVSGLNRMVYAFHANGNLQSGFPVLLDATIPAELAM